MGPIHRIFGNLEEDGSLIIMLEIQINDDIKRIWYPKPMETQAFLLQLHRNKKASDVTFIVQNNNFYAHKLVLSEYAKNLFKLSIECNKDKPIKIANMKKSTFQKILEYVYTVGVPKFDTLSEAIELLRAAKFCGCNNLILHVESTIADKLLIIENAAEMLVFSNIHSYALLKEAAMNVIAQNHDEVIKSVG